MWKVLSPVEIHEYGSCLSVWVSFQLLGSSPSNIKKLAHVGTTAWHFMLAPFSPREQDWLGAEFSKPLNLPNPRTTSGKIERNFSLERWVLLALRRVQLLKYLQMKFYGIWNLLQNYGWGGAVLVNRGKIKHGWPELVIIKAKGWAHGGVSHSSLFFCMSEIFHNEEFLKGHEDSF